MRILGIECYYGGSHKAFLDGWISRSAHQWRLLTLPPNKWKWRMRHSAFTLAEQVNRLVDQGAAWDTVFCSDMLNLAEFRGLVCEAVRTLPTVTYFHENQLTYPVRVENERDYQYAITNFTSALSADAVWFNSAFHRDEFLTALTALFRRMPDYAPEQELRALQHKIEIQHPGIDSFDARSEPRKAGPTRILWAARWEHDKNPDDFFAALEAVAATGLNFRLSVIGEQFREMPEVFRTARERFADRIDHWGYQPSRQAYVEALAEADIVVSTALHEFFGIGIVEAAAAGAYPLLPRRLAYPELFTGLSVGKSDDFFYDGTVGGLTRALKHLIHRTDAGSLWQGFPERGVDAVRKFDWSVRAASLDTAIERLADRNRT